MRKNINRFLSFLLVVVMIAAMVPVLSTPAQAANQNQLNIVARADYLYGIKWTAKKTVYGWRGSYTFSSGSTYRIPYGQPVTTGKYIGFGVSVNDFLTAAGNKSSVFYTSRSSYSGNGSSSVYYAMDCSAFVSWCWGISRKTTYSITQVSKNLGAPTTSNISKLQLGDALNSRSVGHVVLVTGLTYSGSTLTKIEITEQTPPQLKRTTYTPSALASKYGSKYTIQRYSGTVPAAPGGSTSSNTGSSSSGSSSSTSTNGQYYPACSSDYTSIVAALESIGVDSSKDYRTKIAQANGISNYSGTAEQNITLLNLMKEGKLKNPAFSASTVAYFPACASSYTSIVEALNSIGVDSSKDNRTKIAQVNGISNYSGTTEQNVALLDLLKASKLINPAGGSSSGGSSGGSSSGSSGSATTGSNGYANGYTGGMAGDGKIYAHGLDVSAWQGSSLDFKAIKNAGYSYVILRAGTSNGKDTCFETYYTNARAAGLDIGAYYYSYATTVAAAKTDANNMLNWISGKTFEYPLYFDYEDASQDNLSSTMAKDICLTFCDMLANKGYLTGIYTGYSRSTNLPMSTICAKYEIWIARYYDYTYQSLSPTYSSKYGMYQYTDRNYIGSKGPYDGNVSYKDYPAIVKKYGFNGYGSTQTGGNYLEECTMYPAYCYVSPTQSTPLNSQPRSAENVGSDTLKTAAAGETYLATALYRNTAGNYWYKVTLANGETAFLYSGHSAYVKSVGSDIALSDRTAPNPTASSGIFTVSGTVGAQWNKLSGLKVQIHTSAGRHITTAVIPASNNSCDLSGLEMDLSQLSAGYYRYKVIAEYAGYYASGSQTIANYSDEVVLLETSFAVPRPDGTITEAPATEQDAYLDKCSVYVAHCQVNVTKDTTLNSLPSSTEFNGSQVVVEVKGGQTLTAVALYRNTGGTYWYQVMLDNGQTAFLSSGYATFAESASTDISVFDKNIPTTLLPGKSFQISGKVYSTRNRLDNVSVRIYTADGNLVTSKIAYAANNLCDLSEAALDFEGLSVGHYWYKIVAKYSGHYAKTSSEIGEYSSEVTLLETAFTVTDGVDAPTDKPESAQDPYLDKCMVYSAYCKVKVTQSTPLNTLPSSIEFNGSQTVMQAQAGQVFTAVALYRNTGGNYWYQVVLDSGETAFLFSGHSEYQGYVTTDFSLSDKSVPGTLFQGDSFLMSGTAKAVKNRLDEVELRIYSADGALVDTVVFPALGNDCDLSDITLDLSALAVGNYTYRLVAKGFGYYATAPQEIAEYTCERILVETIFSIADEETNPDRNLRPEQNSYLGKCTYYPTYCKVTATQATPLNSLPSSTDYNDSQTVANAAAGQVLTAVALYCNTGGGFWYEVLLDNGETAFLSGGYAKFVEGLSSDISISETAVPDTVFQGDDFLISGMACALRNRLDEVEVQIYTADGLLVRSAHLSATENLCDLSQLKLDFAGLTSGNYLYVIVASYTGYYAATSKEETAYSGRVLLLEAPFAVDVCQHEHHNSAGYCTGCGLAVSHKFENGICDTCGAVNATVPTLTLNYPSLSFEAQIQYNIYYTVANGEHIMEMGLVTFDSKVADGSVDNAKEVITGYVSDGVNYMVHTNGIPAKNLSDALYFRVYARLLDGTYVYSDIAGYHAVAYARSVLGSATSSMKAKALMVAMLNYGAAAQEYFGYKTDELMNGFLSAAGRALVEEYNPSMVADVLPVDNSKAGHFVMNTTAFTSLYPTVSFEGAFSINYYLVNGLTPDSGIMLYYWDEAAYNSSNLLLLSNVSGELDMVQDGDRWYASVEGIAAKDMDKTIYIVAVYKSGGTTYTTRVIPYSLGKYCATIAAQGNDFGAATAVYGYYAKAYFN